MSLNQRITHRRIQARQDNALDSLTAGLGGPDTGSEAGTSTSISTSPTTSATTTKGNGDGNGNGNGGENSRHHTPTSTTSTESTSSTESSASTTSTSSKETTTTSSSSSESTTSTSKTSSSTEETTTTSSSSTQTSASNTVNKLANTPSPSTTLTRTSTSFASSSIDAAATHTSAAASSSSGSLNTGAMVGGIAAGLVVVAIIGAIIAFYIRRWRSRRRADEFDAAQFRRSAMVMDGDSRPNSFWGGAVRPISTFFQHSFRPGHNVAPSISSTQGAGLAGQGAWKNQNQYQAQEYFSDEQPQPEMVQTSPTPQAAGKGLQPRQQYTFGQTFEPEPSPTSAAAFVTPGPLSSGQEYDPYAVAGSSHYAPTSHAYSQAENINYHHAHNGTHVRDEDAYGGM